MVRKKVVKIISMVLTLVLLGSLFVGCAGEGKNVVDNGNDVQDDNDNNDNSVNNENNNAENNNGENNNNTEDETGEVRQIIKEGEVVLELEPGELFIFTKNQPIYEYAPEAREKLIGQYIKEEFPDVKYKIIDWDENGIREDDFKESGVYPDMVLTLVDRDTTNTIKTYEMDYDLTSLIEDHDFDLDRINKSAMSTVYDRSTGGILAIPFEINDYILFYNKDFFDKQDEPYPTAGMTYDEAYEKAEKLTFQDSARMIKGYLQHPDQYLKLNQKGKIPFSLSEANTVELATDEWLNLVDNIRRFYEIDGNVWNSTDDFFSKGTVAMCVENLGKLPYICRVKEYLREEDYEQWNETIEKNHLENWDIAPVPVFEDAPENTYMSNTLGWFITEQSEMKETAFEIIMHLLSDEVQLGRAKDGIKGSIYTEEIAEKFGENIPEYKDLNLEAVYWGENAVQPIRTPEVAGGGYWDIALWQVFRTYIFEQGYNSEDALKTVEEEQNEWIQEQINEGKEW